ncbi:MAG: putative toxin-antitoxin system toxin component, PIN family [Chloroflexota bacterium]|nr:putative toxin-antitoxin system toxin component, PIN family [Chloroflexota bacterium]
MRLALRVVVDTNVWISGLINPDGTPGHLVEAAVVGRIDPVVSWELVRELFDVLARSRIRRLRIEEQDIDDLVATFGQLLPEVVVEVEIRDPDDVAVVAAAIAGNADAIATGDRDFLDDESLRSWLRERGTEVLTPREMVDRLP